ncbi:hypothetical protein [Streptomyces sp. NBC_01768]|uniref:hypothetical protein n=1 Tax=Streptomyces sp. NBC_01768 TaxID=2975938 RepID=UPI002DDACCB5|nr:hypothetical protein [Streptomyces sp. NBC_01768]WSC34086.1 hypothetical protein OG902_47020 [Streptomyces sp. NBC_01768]
MDRQLSVEERLERLRRWQKPAGPAEAERQQRAQRMVREAVGAHGAFADLDITVEAKGSYPNKTNVRNDSDVDIKVQINDPFHARIDPQGFWFGGRWMHQYDGLWKPRVLRRELHMALENVFGTVDDNHNVAFCIPEVPSSRPSADVVPCFKYVQFTDESLSQSVEGSIVYCRDGTEIVNWPHQQLVNGKAKNERTNHRYKFVVRVLKSVENDLADQKVIDPLPSYFSECLVYNVPDHVLTAGSFDDAVRGALQHLQRSLHPLFMEPKSLVEPNGIKPLFGCGQKWQPADGRKLVRAAWTYLNYG